jgi:hypothetical protein
MRSADITMTEELARAIKAQGPLSVDQVASIAAKQRWTESVSQWWLDRRGTMIVYRGQDARVATILSPLARSGGVAQSEALVEKMRAAGLSNEEIAGYTAKWHTQPVPPQFTIPSLGGQPLGSVGIPTTRVPGVAAKFGDVYVLRMPSEAVIKVPRWGLAVENEHVILNQVPKGCTVGTVPASSLPRLTVDPSGKLILSQ